MLEPRAEREAIAGRRVVHPPETEAIRGHHEAPAVREPERDGEGPPEGTGKGGALAPVPLDQTRPDRRSAPAGDLVSVADVEVPDHHRVPDPLGPRSVTHREKRGTVAHDDPGLGAEPAGPGHRGDLTILDHPHAIENDASRD